MTTLAKRSLSPRLACLCADNDEIRGALLRYNLLSTEAFETLGEDMDVVASELRLTESSRPAFRKLFNLTKVKSDISEEDRMNQMVDVLNGEGQLIMKRPRSDVHSLGFWHRGVNVWVLCTSTWRILVGQRSICKDMHPCQWTCVCGRVASGELSRTAALERLKVELSISGLHEDEMALAFSLKCPREFDKGLFAGQKDQVLLDVYVAFLSAEIPVEKLYLDVRAKHAAKYIPVEELQRAYETNDDGYVIPSNEEYSVRLFHYLRKQREALSRPVHD